MSKEHAYAYESGYRDGSINYELEHCPACKNVADIQEALAENAKLRNEVELTKRMYAKVSEDLCAEQADNERLRQELVIREESEQEKCIEYLRQENIDWEDRYRTLANENAKLRELVRELLTDPDAWDYDFFTWRIEKLGIEVE